MTESVHKGVSPSVEWQNPRTPIIDKIAWKWESLLLHLLVMAILMPSAWQSISVGLLGLTFLYRKGWRSNLWSTEVGKLFQKTLIILAGAWIILLGLGVWDALRSDDFAALKPYIRLAGKQGVWGAFAIASMLFFQFFRMRNFLSIRFLLLFTAVLLVYGIAQRYTGIDWVHGFDAKLGDNRFSYGVYRVSGWMDHPLTFAFNLILFSLICFAQAISEWKRENGTVHHAYLWTVQTALLLGLLFLTDSRFPIVLTLILMIFGGIWQFPKTRIAAVSIALLLTIAAVVSIPSVAPEKLGRWGELIDSKQPLEQRFDRIIFWKINSQIFKESPVYGTGLSAYAPRLLDTYQSAGYTSLERKYNAHNIYLQTFADSGVVGGIGLGLIFFALGRLAFRVKKRFFHIALPLVFFATVGSGFVQNNLRDTEFLFALWISIGLSLSWLIVQGKPDDRGSERELEDLKP